MSARDEQMAFQKSPAKHWERAAIPKHLDTVLAAALPVIGPGAAAIGEQIGWAVTWLAKVMGAAMTSVLPVGALAGARGLKIPAGLKGSATAQYGQALRAHQGNHEAPLRSR